MPSPASSTCRTNSRGAAQIHLHRHARHAFAHHPGLETPPRRPRCTEKTTLPRPPLVCSLLSTPATAVKRLARAGQPHDDLADGMAVEAAGVLGVDDAHGPAVAGVLLHRDRCWPARTGRARAGRSGHAIELGGRPAGGVGQFEFRRSHSPGHKRREAGGAGQRQEQKASLCVLMSAMPSQEGMSLFSSASRAMEPLVFGWRFAVFTAGKVPAIKPFAGCGSAAQCPGVSASWR